jgi:hypothetical protein
VATEILSAAKNDMGEQLFQCHERYSKEIMPERMLTLRELNRATLARQMLPGRASFPAFDAVEHLVGLQSQLPDPPYVGLWTRLQAFQRDDLTRLIEQRQVVRATMMRSTLHLMTAQDYALLRPVLQPALTRAMHAFFGASAKSIDVERIVAAARAYIQEEPRTFVQIRARLSELFPDIDPALLAYAVRTHLPLVQVPPGGVWGFTGSPAYAEASTWLERPLEASTQNLHLLIRRYLAAFGPASVKDVQTWSGLIRLQDVLKALKPELRMFRDEQGNELFDLPDGPLPPADIPAPVRFLPEFDNLILSHADRSRFVPAEYRKAVFLTVGRVRATFLVDGFVRGAWKIERAGNVARLVIEPFEPLSPETRSALVEEGEQLVRFVEDSAETFEVGFAGNAS